MGIPAPVGIGASGLPPAGDQANAVVTGNIAAIGPTQPFALRGPLNVAVWGPVASALTTTAGSLNASVGAATGLAVGYSITSANVPRGTTIKTLVGTNITLAIPAITLSGRTNGVDANMVLPATVGGPSMASLAGATVTGPNIPAGTTVAAVIQETVNPTNNGPGTDGIVQLSAIPTAATPYPGQPGAFTFGRTGNAVTATGADAAATYTGSGANFTGSIQLERSFDGGATWLVCNVGGGGALAIYTAGTPLNLTFGEPEKGVLYRLNCTALSAGTINYRLSETGGAAESLSIQLI